MTSTRPINRLSNHLFNECSDLPALPPLFSCDACDRWRNRMHSAHFKNRGSLIRSELSARYQCSRERKGHGPIKIQIICNVSLEPRSSNLLQSPPSLPRNAGVSTRMLQKNQPASAGSSDNSQKSRSELN